MTSHRGDVPITGEAERHSHAVGRGLGASVSGPIRVLSGETRRARDTATHLARGLVDAGRVVSGPTVAFALRNPDLYLGGHRVDMVSSAEALAEQVDGLSAGDVASLAFYPEFIVSPDRIGWWLGHDAPPGDDAAAVARRVRAFALSLLDPVGTRPELVVAVTHSPLLRAVGHDFLGRDIGEPPWVAGLVLTLADDGAITVGEFVPEPA
ncbi:MAG: hypothetical protein WAL25_15375 [Acidimicrobiia bacterium]